MLTVRHCGSPRPARANLRPSVLSIAPQPLQEAQQAAYFRRDVSNYHLAQETALEAFLRAVDRYLTTVAGQRRSAAGQKPMRSDRFSKPPTVLRRAKLDNLAVVPASLLPSKAEWQQAANKLPSGSVLVVLPATDKPQRKVLENVIPLLKTKGHQVTALPAEQFGQTL